MSIARIGTHSGTFHVDEALGVWMLRRLDEYQSSVVIRSRDEAVLSELDILIDVGGVYDANKKRFDHHQRGFFEVFCAGRKTKLSSAGLVYKHYGQRVLQKILGDAVSNDELDAVFHHVYSEFIEGIDGIDNGVPPYAAADGSDITVVPSYKLSTGLSSRVARLNQSWNDSSDSFNSDAAFETASNLAGEEMLYFCRQAAFSWLPARRIVAEAFSKRTESDILVLDQFCPWMDHLFALEKESGNVNIKYVVFTDTSGSFRVRAVPVSPGSFQSRLPLHEKWCGLRDAELDVHLEEKGGVFVHANGFIGGHKSLNGAISMAKQSITMSKA